MSGKRTDYLTWDQYFMGVALLSAQRSKDPNTQVGSCIVDGRKRIVAIGYSGFPTGCPDDELPWEREGPFLDTKYPYVCYIAEVVFLSDKHKESEGDVASRRILELAGVRTRQFVQSMEIVLR